MTAPQETQMLKFADDTTVIGLIRDGDESAYRWEIEQMALLCGQNNLELKSSKLFLGSIISQDLKWESNIDAIRKKAQQRMYFLCQLRKFNLPQELLIQFYTTIIQSVLSTSITVWFGSATKQDRNRLQRTVRTAEKIIGASLPSIQDLYVSRVRKRAGNITADLSRPGHNLFHLLPSSRHYRALYTKTSRNKNSFFPQADALLNI
ncbi:hypothetical protein L3Q82_000156 [Scortum barcoo]|uniref:Uncharacterized protein n=1 Tax=Scortum barcoo TaxID=214431 RepID=A0ACB8XAD1_9TELE|nr:hypothetical protein L3Q82_000156 [Scortum barcoo]